MTCPGRKGRPRPGWLISWRRSPDCRGERLAFPDAGRALPAVFTALRPGVGLGAALVSQPDRTGANALVAAAFAKNGRLNRANCGSRSTLKNGPFTRILRVSC